MKTIYESDELEIILAGGQFKVTDKNTGGVAKWRFSDGLFYDEQNNEINSWDFVKQYPDVVPILIDAKYLEKCDYGFTTGKKFWFIRTYDNEMIHKIIENWPGEKEYYQYNKRHRLDGPAIDYENGKKEWYINGWRVNSTE